MWKAGGEDPMFDDMNETLRVIVDGNPVVQKVVSPSPIANAFIGSDEFPAACLRALTEGVQKLAEAERLADETAKDRRSV